jgi:uncharacterized protein
MIFFKQLCFSVLLFISFLHPANAKEILKDSFKPAWWCRGGHCQTISGHLFRSHPDLPLKRERITTADGDFLDLDWLHADRNAPLVIVLHGFGSSAEASYIRTLLSAIDKKGWRAVAVNARGASGELNRSKEINNAGNTHDLDWVIAHVTHDRNPETLFIVGYSVGGNIVLKWLGEKSANVPPAVKKAVAVSAPYDLEKTAESLDAGFNKNVYTRSLLKTLKAQALEKEKQFPGSIDRTKVEAAKTFKVYDREVSARLNGFQNEFEYWKNGSSANYLEEIRVPTLLISAANDPFLPAKFFPLEKIKRSESLHLLLTRDGGHIGFVSGKIPFRLDPWLENKILSFLEEAQS